MLHFISFFTGRLPRFVGQEMSFDWSKEHMQSSIFFLCAAYVIKALLIFFFAALFVTKKGNTMKENDPSWICFFS